MPRGAYPCPSPPCLVELVLHWLFAKAARHAFEHRRVFMPLLAHMTQPSARGPAACSEAPTARLRKLPVQPAPAIPHVRRFAPTDAAFAALFAFLEENEIELTDLQILVRGPLPPLCMAHGLPRVGLHPAPGPSIKSQAKHTADSALRRRAHG